MIVMILAQAKAHLNDLLERVEAGEEIVITRHGKPVAHIRAAVPPKLSPPLEKLAAFRAGRSSWRRDSATLMSEMRDDERS